jgi:NAD(P)H dehydrogenase (quinone)
MATAEKLFLVTGATGNTGRPTVRLLLERGHRVRALVHRTDARSDALAAAGAEIVAGNLLDLESVSTALSGVTGAYFCYPVEAGLLDATVIFAQAATEAGVRSMVNMSQISARRESKSDAARQHWLSERLFDRTAMLTAHLRPTLFAEWLGWHWRREGEGAMLRLPFEDARHAPVATVDLAYVIAAILEHPEPHDRQLYPLTGPVDLGFHEIAESISLAVGIPVRYEPISIDEFEAILTASGRSAHMIQHLVRIAQDFRDGIFAGANNLIEVIGNHKPLTVTEYVSRESATFKAAAPLGPVLSSDLAVS